ncbi:hypothetical protein DIPPA_31627 [Diplonema papillatum]|nr:hypothetical protein DIPPA_31627 [Diplonema papillatum]
MRTALSRLGKIARVKAVHPALEMRVNHLTSLGAKVLLLTRTDVLIAAASGGVNRRLRLADLTRLTLLHGPAHLGP